MMMLCRKCHEAIDVGEAMRAEPVYAGSHQHHFYHCGCYAQVKEARQCEDQLALPLEDSHMIQAARSVC